MELQTREASWSVVFSLGSAVEAFIFLLIFLVALGADNMVTVIAHEPVGFRLDASVADRAFCVSLNILNKFIIRRVMNVVRR